MTEKYDFENLSPIEFETMSADLLGAETGLRFERFSEGPDGGIDGRHSSAAGDIILQAKHYKNSSWAGLKTAAAREKGNIFQINPKEYYLLTSQRLTPNRKKTIVDSLAHSSVKASRILGRAELNDLLRSHSTVEKRHIKLWLSSSAVLERLLNNNVAVFTEATQDEIERILKVFVANPSLQKAAGILEHKHCLIVSGPPGVGKTTLAQVLAAEYCDEGWELVAVSTMEDALAASNPDRKQVFVFDDFLGKIKLNPQSLARDEGRIARFIDMVAKRAHKRFILTTRSYVFEAARQISEPLDDERIDLSELVLDLELYNREIRARILYNHLYHSSINQPAIDALLSSGMIRKIVDHPNYMPRIIDWMTDHLRIGDVTPSQYPKRFIETLNRPHKIWEKAFRKHISAQARLLLLCMYFWEFQNFPKPGLNPDRLEKFFMNAVEKSGQLGAELFNERFFEETLKEIKSSFIVFDDGRINFINPSVMDFLSVEASNPATLNLLSSAAPTFEIAIKLWKTVKAQFAETPSKVKTVAGAMIDAIQTGTMTGQMPLDRLAGLVGELLLSTYDTGFISFIRKGGLESASWINEKDIIPLIADLEEGRFHKFPHAAPYARLLRQKLFFYVSKRDYVLELDEVVGLAEKLSESKIEFPDIFMEEFIEAAQESIDNLDPLGLSREGRESTISEWVDSIGTLEMYIPEAVDTWKKQEIEEILRGYEEQAETEMERYRDERHLQHSSPQETEFAARQAVRPEFSDRDLGAMFASLKK